MALLSVSNAPYTVPTPSNDASIGDRLSAALVREAGLPPAQISMARHLAKAQGVPVTQVILANGWADEAAVLSALSRVHCARVLDLYRDPVDESLAAQIPVDECLAAGAVPWRRIGSRLAFATWDPVLFQRHLGGLKAAGADPVLALAPRHQVTHAIEAMYGRDLIQKAQYTLPRKDSARDLAVPSIAFMVWALSLVLAAILAFPGVIILALAGSAAFVSVVNMAFKSALMFASLRVEKPRAMPSNVTHIPLAAPRISLLIPLLREAEVAETLLTHIRSLKYPAALTEVFFLLESDDHLTRNTLSRLHLPFSFQVLTVPHGDLRTKPRALNYALPFTSGDIIGVYDAEDRPDPGQLRKVVEGFHDADPKIACLQGRLSFFNAKTNLLSRCFCIEYAGWFSVFLKGLERLDLPIPLGGTTLFFRRAALIDCGAWDAHNVTEDADLGMRLYRHGYRTGLIDSDTLEEANCRVWPWIRQRSRWIKGYMVTWRIHMRDPQSLLRDMGGRATAAFHLLFVGSILAALLTPVHLLFWLAFIGAPVPGLAELRPELLRPLGAGFLVLGGLNIGFWIVALRRTHQRKLILWLPAMHIYFMMSGVAAVKAGIEALVHPHFWDKTRHGIDV